MRYLLQRPRPDELLGSVWIRTARVGGVSLKTTARLLVGQLGWTPSLLGYGHLCALAGFLRLPPQEVLWRHTVFPYLTAHFGGPTFDQAVSNAYATGRTAVGTAAVIQAASTFVPLRRFCRTCAEADVARWGTSHWRRSHHLPGVLFCLEHGEALRETTLPSANSSYDTSLPHEAKGRPAVRGPRTFFDAHLGRISSAVLNRTPGPAEVLPSSHYRDALVEDGLLAPGRDVERGRLSSWALALLPRAPSALGLHGSDGSLAWMARMLTLKPSHPPGTYKHVLFATALEAHKAGGQPIDLTFVSNGPAAASKVAIDAKYARAVRAVVRRYLALGERVRICDALMEAGCWGAYRHNREAFPRVHAAVEALKASDACMRPHWGKGRRS